MKDGKDAEAIEAFEETVKLDPNFRDAWQWLAILYEKTGQEKKAIEAFRKSKQVVRG
jgi:Tfp pilus assembly protein PilF